MKALYSTYGEDDKIILVGKRLGKSIKVINESEFILTDEMEEKYHIFAYSEEHKIFNNGIRHIYEVKLNEDMSNLKLLYKDGDVDEIGVFTNNYIRVYKKYFKSELENDKNKAILNCGNFFSEKIGDIKIGKYEEGELLYFYDGEELEFTLYLKGKEEELEVPIKYEYLDHIKVLLSSVKKDEVFNDVEILNCILEGIYKSIKEKLQKKEIKSLGIVECD